MVKFNSLFHVGDRLRLGLHVLAVYEDSNLYRARILEINDFTCELEFYDYGNVSTTFHDQIFYYDGDFFDCEPPLVSI